MREFEQLDGKTHVLALGTLELRSGPAVVVANPRPQLVSQHRRRDGAVFWAMLLQEVNLTANVS